MRYNFYLIIELIIITVGMFFVGMGIGQNTNTPYSVTVNSEQGYADVITDSGRNYHINEIFFVE